MIEILSQPLPSEKYQRLIQDLSCGGLCVFEGRIRTHNHGQEVASLEYECYLPMALKQLEALRSRAVARWGLKQALIAHRIGPIPLGEAAVWIGAASAHRAEAFEAARFMIDELKLKVPIWKKERYASGKQAWVACGQEDPAAIH